MPEEEIWFKNCSQSRIKKIDELRKQGLSWDVIGQQVHAHEATVNRWHRNYVRHGLEVFARD
jgi:transposase